MLIAGSFTPVHVILLRDLWHRHLLAWIWIAAIAGLVLKTVYFDTTPQWLGLMMYLGLGWLGLISTVALARRFGVRFVFHLAVLAGISFHWAFIRRIAGWEALPVHLIGGGRETVTGNPDLGCSPAPVK